ncbi:MAG: ArsR family transcriptional regulator, partial [Bacteroidota bacterium]|nr:ArsR family transcriptional regulator [Bacteroidota bacterium]
FGESTNAIRQELNKFEKAGLLNSYSEGNKKMFRANTEHPLFHDIHSILLKHLGFDHIIEKVIRNLGEVQSVFIVGDFAKGIDTNIIDLIFMGDKINRTYLFELVEKAEQMIKRKVRFLVLNYQEYKDYKKDASGIEPLLLWKREVNVLLND